MATTCAEAANITHLVMQCSCHKNPQGLTVAATDEGGVVERPDAAVLLLLLVILPEVLS